MNSQRIYSDRLYRVTSFEIVSAYTIHTTFDDGTERTINLEPILTGPVFGPLRDVDVFNQATLDEDFGAITWPNGADIAPSVLHDWPEHVESIIARRRQQLQPQR